MEWLFDTGGFTPRNSCGPGWTDLLRSVSTISNTIIFVCYVLIPFGIFSIYKKLRSNQPMRAQSLGCILFCAFVFSCGLTHLMDRLMFVWPAYRLTALVLFVTAVISLSTVCWLFVAGSRHE